MRVHPTAAEPGPVVLVAGAASRDVTRDDPRGWRLGGAVTYASLTLARLGLRVRAVLGLDEAAAGAAELGVLADAGVELVPTLLASGPVFENVETAQGRRQHCLAVASPMRPPTMTASERQPDAVLLAPIAGELPDDWLAVVPPTARVAVGLQGMLREVTRGRDVRAVPPRRSALLERADLLSLSRGDLGPAVRLEAVAIHASAGSTLVVTDGTNGGEVFRIGTGGHVAPIGRYRAVAADGTADPTGAGDVFLAAIVASRLVPALAAGGGALLARELWFAAAAASLVVEAPGILGVPTLDGVRDRLDRARSRASRCASVASRRGSGRPSQA